MISQINHNRYQYTDAGNEISIPGQIIAWLFQILLELAINRQKEIQ